MRNEEHLCTTYSGVFRWGSAGDLLDVVDDVVNVAVGGLVLVEGHADTMDVVEPLKVTVEEALFEILLRLTAARDDLGVRHLRTVKFTDADAVLADSQLLQRHQHARDELLVLREILVEFGVVLEVVALGRRQNNAASFFRVGSWSHRRRW